MVIALSMSVIFASACAKVSVGEILPDPSDNDDPSFPIFLSFEPGEDGLPTNWNIVRGTLGNEIRFQHGIGREGGWAFWFYDVSGDRNRSVGIISDSIDIVAGEEYEASIWIKVNDEGSGRLYLQFFNSGGERMTSHAVSEPQRGHNEWVRISVSGTAPPEATHAKLMIDSGSTASARVDLYFDSAELAHVAH